MDFETNSLPVKNNPRLTIALGVYNDSGFLPGGLDSLLSQTFTDFELVISDNASTDETPDIIKRYSDRDPRIRVIRQSENIGMAGNYNFLGKQGQSEYFMWAACDDRWSPDYVETIMTEMEKDTSIILGFTPYKFIDEDGKSFGKVRSFNYSGKTAFSRLVRFFKSYDDGMTYGIFRYSAIKDVEFPVWWWLNKKAPLNAAFGFLPYVLAKGNFHLYGNQPLWFNCLKSVEHYQPFRQKNKKLLFLLLFIVRKINLAVVQFQNIWRGSGSILLSIVLIPVLGLRIILDTLNLVRNTLMKINKFDANQNLRDQ